MDWVSFIIGFGAGAMVCALVHCIAFIIWLACPESDPEEY